MNSASRCKLSITKVRTLPRRPSIDYAKPPETERENARSPRRGAVCRGKAAGDDLCLGRPVLGRAAVLELLEEEKRSPVVFHWYSGSLTVLARAVAAGHFFSINPAMIQSAKGRRIIDALPPERVLGESDGPFVRVGKNPARPADVSLVEEYLASLWQVKRSEASTKIRTNFLDLIRPLRDFHNS